jgi:hypothetical protein
MFIEAIELSLVELSTLQLFYIFFFSSSFFNTESTFKRSVEKDRAELEFVAVNLHLQCLAVSTDVKSSTGIFFFKSHFKKKKERKKMLCVLFCQCKTK